MRSFALLAILAGLAMASSIPTVFDASNSMQWTGPSKGVNITLYGNAQSIWAQLKALDPSWTPKSEQPGYVKPTLESIKAKYSNATKRAEGNYLCCPVSGQSWTPVQGTGIESDIEYLRDIEGGCLTQPNSCALAQNDMSSQVACNDGAGIYVCNSTPDLFIGLNCDDIGNWAEDLLGNCLDVGENGGTYMCGQLFDTSGEWNTVISPC